MRRIKWKKPTSKELTDTEKPTRKLLISGKSTDSWLFVIKKD